MLRDEISHTGGDTMKSRIKLNSPALKTKLPTLPLYLAIESLDHYFDLESLGLISSCSFIFYISGP